MEIGQFYSLIYIERINQETNVNAMEKLTIKLHIEKSFIYWKTGSLFPKQTKLKSFSMRNLGMSIEFRQSKSAQ